MDMTAPEFKAKYPHLSHLEGQDLSNSIVMAMLIESIEGKPKEVTDWKGNVLKEGDEFCFIKIRNASPFKNRSLIFPGGKIDGLQEIKIPDDPEEDCWEIGEYMKVEKEEFGLFYTTKLGESTIHKHISILNFCLDSNHILAIKGVSDFKD